MCPAAKVYRLLARSKDVGAATSREAAATEDDAWEIAVTEDDVWEAVAAEDASDDAWSAAVVEFMRRARANVSTSDDWRSLVELMKVERLSRAKGGKGKNEEDTGPAEVGPP